MNGEIISLMNRSNNKRQLTTYCCYRFLIKFMTLLTSIVIWALSLTVHADQQIQDDLIVTGSLCVGFDCSNGEAFNFDTIRLKENNVRIKFIDSSSSSSFPTIDWEIVVNDSVNGGLNKFSIGEVDSGNTPFTILQSAPNHSLYITAAGYVGMGTSAPVMHQHILHGNSPAIRLHQNGTSGFAEQVWDVGGNESNFFIRDVSNNGRLPFRLSPGAPSSSIHIASDGDIGFETSTPDGQFDIAHSGDANNHAVLVNSASLFGINIDNGFNPRGQLDVQSTGGVSRFMVQSDGKVGLGLGTSGTANGLFDVQISGVSKLTVDADGDLGVGTGAPTAVLNVNRASGKDTFRIDSVGAANTTHLIVNEFGQVAIGTHIPVGSYTLSPHFEVFDNTVVTQSIRTGSDFHTANLAFSANGSDKWLISSRHFFNDAGIATPNRMAFYNGNKEEVLTLHQLGRMVLGTKAGGDNSTSHAFEVATANNAHLTTGGVWTNASSRQFKHDIADISLEVAKDVVEALKPVTFNYNSEPEENYAGFIAEDVPDLVATNDRKSLSTMDIVAVLTKVVQDQQKNIKQLNQRLDEIDSKSRE